MNKSTSKKVLVLLIIFSVLLNILIPIKSNASFIDDVKQFIKSLDSTLKSEADTQVIEISTSEEMWNIANNFSNYNGKTIKLTKDINLGCSSSK